MWQFVFLLTALCLCPMCTLCALLHEEDGWQQFCARSDSDTKLMLYRGKAFPHWKRNEPVGSTIDTMKPICEFSIGEGTEAIRLTMHNFPIHTLAQRVTPAAQVLRWKRQFNLTNPLKTTITPVSRGGFSGLFLEALEHPTAILGWSMNMADEHARHLLVLGGKDLRYRDMHADYTIKAVGPLESILQYKAEIECFARSFELIEEIPLR